MVKIMVYDNFTKKEIIESTKKANEVEIYIQTDDRHDFHSDCISSSLSLERIDDLPYDEDGKVPVCIEIMNKEDYSNTIIANSSVSWEDFGWEDDDKIAIIMVDYKHIKIKSIVPRLVELYGESEAREFIQEWETEDDYCTEYLFNKAYHLL